MKKTTIAFIIAAAACTLLVGCTSVRDNVPATQISGTLNGAPFSFSGPKDLTAGAIFITASNAASCVTMSITNLSARTNPDIISLTGDAYAKMRQADSAYVNGLIDSVGSSVGQAGKTFIK